MTTSVSSTPGTSSGQPDSRAQPVSLTESTLGGGEDHLQLHQATLQQKEGTSQGN